MRPTTTNPPRPQPDAAGGPADEAPRAGGYASSAETFEAARRAWGSAPASSAGETDPEPAGDQPATAATTSAPAARAARKRRPAAPVEKTSKRGLYLGDDVWDRLSLEAHHKRTTASAIAQAILEKHLPRFTLNREG